ncbi:MULTISPECIES: hypothetical protein [unclassified Methylobacterium]|uniref:hypothetical protein n=1 Tax=unclassified Methylobacterium TaxID=2615210 RepID=UPI00226AA6E0|nr:MULTISPECIES: hypothetical protein [unclassified Methylobacterium]
MRIANWTYTGRGRIALSKPPQGTPRGYRLAPDPFFIGDTKRLTAEIWAMFALADACALYRQLCVMAYPWEPVLVSSAAAGTSYCTLLAEWLSAQTGEVITELTSPETHQAIKIRRPALHGLGTGIWPIEGETETVLENV